RAKTSPPVVPVRRARWLPETADLLRRLTPERKRKMRGALGELHGDPSPGEPRSDLAERSTPSWSARPAPHDDRRRDVQPRPALSLSALAPLGPHAARGRVRVAEPVDCGRTARRSDDPPLSRLRAPLGLRRDRGRER